MRQSRYVLAGLALMTMMPTILPHLDLEVASFFYCDQVPGSWCHKQTQPWDWFYHHGNIPGITIGIVGLILVIRGEITRRRGRSTRVGLFLVISLLLGPGLMVNSVLKPLWGRPRPRNIVQFRADGKEFRPVLQPLSDASGRSFPSGHVATAFYTGSLAWLCAGGLNIPLLVVSLAYGLLMSIARMAQGAHFLSDALWAALITWATMAIVAKFPLPPRKKAE